MTLVYREWINSLKDRIARARIQVRIERLAHGNPGKHRRLSAGITELKVDIGAGYRIYYMEQGERLIILLGGGDKSTQRQDIQAAIALAKDLQDN